MSSKRVRAWRHRRFRSSWRKERQSFSMAACLQSVTEVWKIMGGNFCDECNIITAISGSAKSSSGSWKGPGWVFQLYQAMNPSRPENSPFFFSYSAHVTKMNILLYQGNYEIRSVFHKLAWYDSLGCLLKLQILLSLMRFQFNKWEWRIRICIFIKVPGNCFYLMSRNKELNDLCNLFHCYIT